MAVKQSKQLTVSVVGLDALRLKLREGTVFTPARSFLKGLGRVGQKTAQRAAKPHPADKGSLGRAILLDFALDGSSARIKPARSIIGIANTLEGGRRPGKRPPYGPIKRWMISHGIITGARGEGKKVQEMREDIKAKGTRGIYFMQAAQDAVNLAMHAGIPKTERGIKALWDRK
jgi:hypothetical protein